MKKPNFKDYLCDGSVLPRYYVDLAAYWEHLETECIQELQDIGEVYKGERGEYRWKDTGELVRGGND